MLMAGDGRRFLAAFTLILAVLLMGISWTPVEALVVNQHMSIEGVNQSGLQNVPITEYPIPLLKAGSLSIAPELDGSFWIAEFSAGSIAHFLPWNGTFRQFPVPEVQALPAYIALDELGMVWFSDQSGGGSIWMFDPGTGNFTKHPTTTNFSYPVGVAFDSNHDVWFAEDSANNLGELVYPTYSIKEFPLPQFGSGPAELAIQQGRAFPNIWLTESIGNRIAMFNTTTNTFKEFAPVVPFASPVGIVLDKAGHVWVAEHGGSSIVEFDPKTTTFTYFPTSPPPATSGYQNSAPATLALDNKGRLWFVEHFSNKVGRLDPTTRSIDEFQIPSTGVYSVLSAIDRGGNFWFTEFSANKIGTISGNANAPLTVRALPPPSGSISAGDSVMEGFRVANNGTTAISLQLSATTTFSQNGGSSGASLNLTRLSLQPGKTTILLVSVNPDSGLAPGSYSVGVAGQYGNMSTVGILALQITASATNVLLYQTLPDFFAIILIALALANVYVWLIRKDGGKETKPNSSGIRLVCWLVVLSTILLLGSEIAPATVAKCPGLPGIGSSSSGPNYVGIVIDVVEIAGTAILAYLLVKGLLQDRKERKKRVRS